jgi:hypothetical protein
MLGIDRYHFEIIQFNVKWNFMSVDLPTRKRLVHSAGCHAFTYVESFLSGIVHHFSGVGQQMLHSDERLGPRFKLGKQTRRVHQIEQQTDTFRIDLSKDVQRAQARLTMRDNQRAIAIGAYLDGEESSDR